MAQPTRGTESPCRYELLSCVTNLDSKQQLFLSAGVSGCAHCADRLARSASLSAQGWQTGTYHTFPLVPLLQVRAAMHAMLDPQPNELAFLPKALRLAGYHTFHSARFITNPNGRRCVRLCTPCWTPGQGSRPSRGASSGCW